MGWIEHVIAALVGLLLPLAALRRGRQPACAPPPVMEPGEKIALYWSNASSMAVLTALVVLAAWLGGRSMSELGLRFPGERVAEGLALGAILLGGFALDTFLKLRPRRLQATRERWHRDTPFAPVSAREVRHSLAMVTSAAVGEEVIYRGFLISYLANLLSPWPWSHSAAVVLPALVFGASHAYQGLQAATKIAAFAILFGAIVVLTGSLWIVVAVHFVIDLTGMLLAPRVMAPSVS